MFSLSTALLVLSCMILIGNAATGVLRGIQRMSVRLLTLIAALIVAYMYAGKLANELVHRLTVTMQFSLTSLPVIGSFFAENPTVVEEFNMLLPLMIAPLLLLICYWVIKLASFIIYALICMLFGIKNAKKSRFATKSVRVYGGLAVGLLCGMVGVMALSVPVMGYLSVTDNVLTVVNETKMMNGKIAGVGIGSVDQIKSEIVTPARESAVLSTAYKMGGEKMFEGLTKCRIEGDRVMSLKTEATAFIKISENVLMLSAAPVAEYGEEQVNALKGIAEGVGESVLVSDLSAGFLSGAAKAWLNGDTYFGVPAPEIEGTGEPLMDAFLKIFSTETPETVSADMYSMAELFALFVEKNAFVTMSDETGGDALALIVGDPAFISRVKTVLDTNTRLAPLSTAFTDVGMRVLISRLGYPNDYVENHGELFGNMAAALRGATTKDALSDSLSTTFGDYGIEVSSAATDLVAEGLMFEFTPDEVANMSDEDLAFAIVVHMAAVEGANDAAALLPAEPPADPPVVEGE